MNEMFIDLAKYRIQRAFENKGDAEILLKSDKLLDAVNRVYKANFYAVKSLLATKMKDSMKQQVVLNTFHEHFIQTGEVPKEYGQIIDRSYRSRDQGERHEQLQVTPGQAKSLLDDCEKFLAFVREYLQQYILANPRKAENSSPENGKQEKKKPDNKNGKKDKKNKR